MIAPRWFVLVCAAFTSFKKKQKNFFLIHFFPLLFLDVSLCFSAICMGLSMRNSRPGCLEKIAKYIEIRKNSVVIWLEDTWWHQSSMVFDLTVSHWSLGATSSPWTTHIMMTFCPWGDVFFYLFNWNSLLLLLLSVVVVVFVITSSASVHFYLWNSSGSWIKAGFLMEGVKYLRDSVNNLRADQVWLQILIRSIFLDFA